MNTHDFVAAHGITMKLARVARNPHMMDWVAGVKNYFATFELDGRTFSVYYSQGPGLPDDPAPGDVLDMLLGDVRLLDQHANAKDFASDLGFTDVKEATRIYRMIQSNTADLRAFLGSERFAGFLQCESL